MAAPVSHWLRLFKFSSETTERNSTKVDRNQDLNILYQVCVFFFGQSVYKNVHPGWSFKKVAHCTQVHVMWPFGPLVFSADRKNRMADLASDRLRRFRLLLWNRWKELVETRQGARSQRPLPFSVFVFFFFGPIGKSRWRLIDWVIFDFSSETTQRNSTKLDRKQDLNLLYQFFFQDNRKTR